MKFATHRVNTNFLFNDFNQKKEYLINLGFSPYRAKKYLSAIELLTDNEYSLKYRKSFVELLRDFWIKGKDRLNPFSKKNRYEIVESFHYKFRTIGEVARAIENFISTRVSLDGSFHPKTPLYRGIAGNVNYFERLMKIKVGEVIETKSTLNTTTSEQIALLDFCYGPHSILLEFRGGFTKTASVEDITNIGGEEEVLLGRKTKMKCIEKILPKESTLNFSDEDIPRLVFEEVKTKKRRKK